MKIILAAAAALAAALTAAPAAAAPVAPAPAAQERVVVRETIRPNGTRVVVRQRSTTTTRRNYRQGNRWRNVCRTTYRYGERRRVCRRVRRY